jgi:hypothetical protein
VSTVVEPMDIEAEQTAANETTMTKPEYFKTENAWQTVKLSVQTVKLNVKCFTYRLSIRIHYIPFSIVQNQR